MHFGNHDHRVSVSTREHSAAFVCNEGVCLQFRTMKSAYANHLFGQFEVVKRQVSASQLPCALRGEFGQPLLTYALLRCVRVSV